MFENAPVGYMLLDPAGLVEGLNHAGAAMLGWDRCWLVGKAFAQWVVRPDRRLLRAHVCKVYGCQEAVSQLLRVKNRHGHLVKLRLISVRVQASSARDSGLRCIMIDVTGEQGPVHNPNQLASTLRQPASLNRAGTRPALELNHTNGSAVQGDGHLAHERDIVAGRCSRLTERERQVMKLVVSDLSNKEIARRLMISPRTVEHHREHVMVKMEAHSVADLVTMAVLCGIHQLNLRTHAHDARSGIGRPNGGLHARAALPVQR